MVLRQLTLQSFRNFKKRSFEFLPGMTIIVGPNTFGKTNILEAIYMLSTGKSFRAEIESEIISYGEEIARISGVTNFNSLEILITTGSVGGKKAPKKQFLVNGVKKRMTDFIGNFFAVLFSPQDLQLITDSPSLRRKYLNSVLSCVDKEYRRALLVYEKGLRQRNRILETIKEKRAQLSQLEYWNKLLITNGSIVTKKREEFIEFVNSKFGALNRYKIDSICHPELAVPRIEWYGDSGSIKIPKRHACRQAGVRNDTKFLGFDKDVFGGFGLIYEKNEISGTRLEEKREKEIILGVTLAGPHRDDFVVSFEVRGSILRQSSGQGFEGRDLSIYGSRGEQRLAVLWLKLGELAFLEEKTGRKPVLLLDDIFSELDQDYRNLVNQIIPHQQTIITTTDEEVIKREFLKEAKLIKLKI